MLLSHGPIPGGFVYIFTVLLGLILGSFLNVVIARLPETGKLRSVVSPRSRCPECKSEIRWYDNVPVLSYLALKGQCRSCKATISVRYPMVELLTAFLFLAALVRFGFGFLLFIRDWPFMMLLIAITFIDLQHRIIPDKLNLIGIVIGLATSWVVPGFGIVSSLAGAVTGLVLFYIFAWLYLRLTGRSGLGGGDIKLLAMMGSFLGPLGVFWTVLISSLAGSVIGVIWGVAARRQDPEQKLMTLAIPYGPFLVIGCLCYYLLGDHPWFQFMTPM